MSLQEALLNEIREHPEDDAPRLVYADWLEERGDPFAEFIRVQCQLARTLPNERGYQSLRHRETKLYDTYGKAWADALGGVGSVIYQRGLIHLITLRPEQVARQLEQIARSPHLGPLQYLALSGVWDEDGIAQVTHSPILQWVYDLTMREIGLTSQGAKSLASSPHLGNLERLFIGDNPLGDDGLIQLSNASLPKLSRLHAHEIGAGDPGVAAFAASFGQSLENVVLSRNRIGANGLAAILRSNCFKLKTLNLNGNRLGDRGMMVFSQGIPLTGLTTLSLCHNQIGDLGLEAFCRSASVPQLRTLSLSDNALTDRGVIALAETPHLAELENLDLQRNPGIGAAAQVVLANSESFPALERLSIDPLYEQGAWAFVRTNSFPSLSKIFYGNSELENDVRDALRFRYPDG